jgi:hypothetical protein
VREADNLPPYSADVKKSRSLNSPRPLWACMACNGCAYTARVKGVLNTLTKSHVTNAIKGNKAIFSGIDITLAEQK